MEISALNGENVANVCNTTNSIPKVILLYSRTLLGTHYQPERCTTTTLTRYPKSFSSTPVLYSATTSQKGATTITTTNQENIFPGKSIILNKYNNNIIIINNPGKVWFYLKK
jgi:hypothetical protein